MPETTHPLLSAVYASILRDEARHRRLGSLHFEWAANRLRPEECMRFGLAALDALDDRHRQSPVEIVRVAAGLQVS